VIIPPNVTLARCADSALRNLQALRTEGQIATI
jgi:hypothetical protein